MDGRLSAITRHQGCVAAAILMAFVMATAQPIGAAETVGGTVYSNIALPLGTGVPGVQVYVEGPAGNFETTTADDVSPLLDGLWDIANVPVGTYTVRMFASGYRFEHVVAGASDADTLAQSDTTSRSNDLDAVRSRIRTVSN